MFGIFSFFGCGCFFVIFFGIVVWVMGMLDVKKME